MIYLYLCPEHGEIQRDFPMGQQPDLVVCDVDGCGQEAVRIFTPPNVHYRGTGWGWSKNGVRHGDPDMDDRKREHVTPNAQKTGYG
jgi:hypothetical protein